ncbi:MAG: hypothetical protein ABSB89_01655 [Candidatus Bathyarchaeia archaeon]|jgi:hypothetical protein
MALDEDYLKLLLHIGTFTKEATGISIVDAYFGPKKFLPRKTEQVLSSEKLILNLETLIDRDKEIDDKLRRIVILTDLQSMKIVVRWLSGDTIPYPQLVKGIFGITPSKFSQNEIRKAQERVEAASTGLPGSDVSEKISRWREESKVSGKALKKMMVTEVVRRTKEIEELFEKKVFTNISLRVKNKGVVYRAVSGEPWGAYNYYQGDYTSVNAVNLDRTFNKYRFIGMLCHEYEHHIANVFTEHYYRETKALDMCVALLHTKRSIINEGTADCAREFLNLMPTECGELLESLGTLQSMIGLNVAYMLNVESIDIEKAAEYVSSEGFIPIEDAKQSLNFSRPVNPNGKPNLFKPYVYTYYFGRRDYVLPTFKKAERKGKLNEFFRTLYLNPYSRSSATWKAAFSKI